MFRLPPVSKVLLTALEYAWAIAVVLNGNSVYHANGLQKYYLLELSVLLTYVLLLAEAWIRHIPVRRGGGAIAVVVMVYNVIYLSFRQSNIAIVDFALLFVMGLPGLLLLFLTLHKNGLLLVLIRKLFDVVFVLAVISLYYWTFGVILRIISPNMYTMINWGYARYISGFDGLHFVTQLDTTFFPDQYIYRNSGVFAEAPMFNLWLDLALASELFLKERSSKLRLAVLTITIFTTMSVTGIVFITLCLAIYVAWNFHTMGRTQRYLVLLAATIAIPAAGGLAVYSIVLKSDTQSYLMRLSDYTAGVKLWFDHPVFGSGYGDLQSLMQYMYSPDGVLGFSNSLTAVLGTGGIWMSSLFYIPHLCMISPRMTGDRRFSAFGLCYFYLFCTTAFFGRYIAVVMIAFGATVILLRKGLSDVASAG